MSGSTKLPNSSAAVKRSVREWAGEQGGREREGREWRGEGEQGGGGGRRRGEEEQRG